MKRYVIITIEGLSIETDNYIQYKEIIDRLFELQVIDNIEAYYEVDITQ